MFSIVKGQIMANFDDAEFGRVAAGEEMLMSMGALLGPIVTTGVFTYGFGMTGLEDCSLGTDKHYIEAALPWIYSAGGILLLVLVIPICKRRDPFTTK